MESQRESFIALLGALILAVVLVYMVLASQFKSLIDPFIIMFSVPLGLIGVLWALFLTETNLSVTSFMGVIMMAGIVVSNGILLVDYTNRLRGRGMELRGGGHSGRADPAAADSDDHPLHDPGPDSHGHRPGRRFGIECPHGHRGHRRAFGFDDFDPGIHSDPVHDF